MEQKLAQRTVVQDCCPTCSNQKVERSENNQMNQMSCQIRCFPSRLGLHLLKPLTCMDKHMRKAKYQGALSLMRSRFDHFCKVGFVISYDIILS